MIRVSPKTEAVKVYSFVKLGWSNKEIEEETGISMKTINKIREIMENLGIPHDKDYATEEGIREIAEEDQNLVSLTLVEET
jgi:DNA-binding NarL/FixJ family response regulator